MHFENNHHHFLHHDEKLLLASDESFFIIVARICERGENCCVYDVSVWKIWCEHNMIFIVCEMCIISSIETRLCKLKCKLCTKAFLKSFHAWGKGGVEKFMIAWENLQGKRGLTYETFSIELKFKTLKVSLNF